MQGRQFDGRMEFNHHRPGKTRLASHLGTFIVITNSDGSLAFTEAMGPKSLQRRGSIKSCQCQLWMKNSKGEDLRARHAVMSKEQPEAKDGLGENIEDGVAYNLGVNASNTGTIGKPPDTGECQGKGEQGGAEAVYIG